MEGEAELDESMITGESKPVPKGHRREGGGRHGSYRLVHPGQGHGHGRGDDIPLAAGVLAPVGILLSPAVGAVLMSLSTIIVALNIQLLRGLDLRPSRA